MKTNIFKTFAKTITTGFLCATVICGSVLGDVFEAKLENGDPVILAPDAFADWVALHPKMEGLQNKFTGNNWQMPGFAVFFPEGSSEHQQVYVAMKREYQKGQSLADNNPEKAGGHTSADHDIRCRGRTSAVRLHGYHLRTSACVPLPAFRVARDNPRIHNRCPGAHHLLHSLCRAERNAPPEADESQPV